MYTFIWLCTTAAIIHKVMIDEDCDKMKAIQR